MHACLPRASRPVERIVKARTKTTAAQRPLSVTSKQRLRAEWTYQLINMQDWLDGLDGALLSHADIHIPFPCRKLT